MGRRSQCNSLCKRSFFLAALGVCPSHMSSVGSTPAQPVLTLQERGLSLPLHNPNSFSRSCAYCPSHLTSAHLLWARCPLATLASCLSSDLSSSLMFEVFALAVPSAWNVLLQSWLFLTIQGLESVTRPHRSLPYPSCPLSFYPGGFLHRTWHHPPLSCPFLLSASSTRLLNAHGQ